MPRLTLLRLILLPILCYIILVATFVALPSIHSVNGGNYGTYFQDVLRTGNRLTTVYENKRIYDSLRNLEYTERSYFAVDWQLISDVEHNSINLHIGTNTSIDLTSFTNVQPPYISNETIFVSARAGDTDGVMLPWFEPADAALMNWDIERDPKYIDMRVVVMHEGVVQIWPESTHWYLESLELPSPADDTFKPFLTITHIPTTGDKTDVSHIEIDDMTWNVPTMTFPIRRFILIKLKPITLYTIMVVSPVAEVIFGIISFAAAIVIGTIQSAIYLSVVGAAVTLGCWWSCGRPPFNAWAQDFFLTRWMYAKFDSKAAWNTTSPSTDIEEGPEPQHRIFVERVGPQPLTCVVDFFRSSSPMDDLLVTFESTKWLLEPIGRDRSLTERRFEPSDGVTTVDVGEEKIKPVG